MLDMGEYWVRGKVHYNFKGSYVRKSDNVRFIYSRNHPSADGKGYVQEHKLVCEDALGRLIKRGEVVHHINGNPLDNRKSNLVLCEDNIYHARLHRRQRALEGCGSPNGLRCCVCKEYDNPENLKIYRVKPNSMVRAYHKKCQSEYDHKRWKVGGR